MIKSLIGKYIILLTPFIAAGIAQVIKISIRQRGQRQFRIKDFFKFTYSGMPSGHTALITATVTIIGLVQGFSSPAFAFSFVIAMVIINDAVRLRNYLGQHGEILNVLVKDLKDDNVLDEKYPRLLENIGHTPKQVLVGSLIGVFTGILMYWIF